MLVRVFVWFQNGYDFCCFPVDGYGIGVYYVVEEFCQDGYGEV